MDSTSGWDWSSLGLIYKQNSARPRKSTSGRATAQRRQTLSAKDRGCKEAATKWNNYTANKADDEKEHRLPTFQQNAVNRIRNETDEESSRGKFTVSKLSVLRCNDRPRQQAFYTPSVRSTWGVSFQRTEDSQSAFSPFYSKLYFTMNTDNVWHVAGKGYICQGHGVGTQRKFSENICSKDDLRSRIFGTFVVTFLACLPLLGFSNI